MSGRVTQVAHELLASGVVPGAQVIDATVGWGQDTLWLARRVGLQGRVWGIDCQAQALAHTRDELVSQGLDAQVVLSCREHGELDAWRDGPGPESVHAAVVNLGYLPGEDQKVCTQLEQTQALLVWLYSRLRRGARMVFCVYPGHPQGQRESAWLHDYARRFPGVLGRSWVHQVVNRGDTCPWIWSVDKASRGATLELCLSDLL